MTDWLSADHDTDRRQGGRCRRADASPVQLVRRASAICFLITLARGFHTPEHRPHVKQKETA